MSKTNTVKEHKEYYANGNLRLQTSYTNGKRHGIFKLWHDNGQLFVNTTYVQGNKQGEFKSWHKNGNIMVETNYVDNLRQGEYKEWDEDGQLYMNITYAKGYIKPRYVKRKLQEQPKSFLNAPSFNYNLNIIV